MISVVLSLQYLQCDCGVFYQIMVLGADLSYWKSWNLFSITSSTSNSEILLRKGVFLGDSKNSEEALFLNVTELSSTHPLGCPPFPLV